MFYQLINGLIVSAYPTHTLYKKIETKTNELPPFEDIKFSQVPLDKVQHLLIRNDRAIGAKLIDGLYIFFMPTKAFPKGLA